MSSLSVRGSKRPRNFIFLGRFAPFFDGQGEMERKTASEHSHAETTRGSPRERDLQTSGYERTIFARKMPMVNNNFIFFNSIVNIVP